MADKLPKDGKIEHDEGGMSGAFGQPGQRIIEEINPLTEALAIERKASLLAKSVFMIELVIFIPFVLAFLTFGYAVILVVAEACIVLAFVGWCKLLEWRVKRYGEEGYNVLWPLIACSIAAILLAVFWNNIVYGVGFKYRLMTWALFLTVYFIVPVIVSRSLLVWRMSGEVADQNPRKAMDYPKFVFPWTKLHKVANWNRTEVPAPAPEENKEWMTRAIDERRGYGHWDFYTPPHGIDYLEVWIACRAIFKNYDPARRVYVWPGLGGIPALGSKKHPKLQQDWVDKGLATTGRDNNVVLLHRGVQVMEQVLDEPRPNGRHG